MNYDTWKATNPQDEWLGPEEDMSNELTETNIGVPAWMKKLSTGTSFGNVDASDLKPPRLKILAGQSPEVMDGVPGAQVGHFWMTIFNRSLGPAVVGTPILLRKTYQLWAPRSAGSENKGPLATASDGIHWDIPNQKFEVRFPPAQGGGEYTWEIKRTVTENGMHKFGSSQPDYPSSKPAATLTYDVLWVIDMPIPFPDGKFQAPQKQLCVFTNARTGITPTQNFISAARAQGVDQFYQRWRIVSKKKTNNQTGDPYFTYEYQYAGMIQTEAEGSQMRALYDQYSKSGFITDFEGEADEPKPKPAPEVDEDLPF